MQATAPFAVLHAALFPQAVQTIMSPPCLQNIHCYDIAQIRQILPSPPDNDAPLPNPTCLGQSSPHSHSDTVSQTILILFVRVNVVYATGYVQIDENHIYLEESGSPHSCLRIDPKGERVGRAAEIVLGETVLSPPY